MSSPTTAISSTHFPPFLQHAGLNHACKREAHSVSVGMKENEERKA